MSHTIRIAVDAMGGDNSPQKIVDGIVHNHNHNKNVFHFQIVYYFLFPKTFITGIQKNMIVIKKHLTFLPLPPKRRI